MASVGAAQRVRSRCCSAVVRAPNGLPSSGDQFASLDATSAALEPEEFENIEVGIKWDVGRDLSVTAAIHQLDRTNTRAPGSTPGMIVLTGSQPSEGVELGVSIGPARRAP